ncbi:MAG: hypothetical protein H0W83_10250 [Planctomycetes bacterium]|nr:hypothetical protein [Planctomycetota bacterium]
MPETGAAIGSGTPCARHARNQAAASCERCGAFMCELCRIDCDGKALCSTCFERMEAEGSLPSVRRTMRNYNGMAFHLSLYGVLLFIIGWIIGPVAIWLAIKGTLQNRRNGERVSQTAGIIAMVVGTLDTVGGILFMLAMFGVFGR